MSDGQQCTCWSATKQWGPECDRFDGGGRTCALVHLDGQQGQHIHPVMRGPWGLQQASQPQHCAVACASLATNNKLRWPVHTQCCQCHSTLALLSVPCSTTGTCDQPTWLTQAGNMPSLLAHNTPSCTLQSDDVCARPTTATHSSCTA